MDAKASPDAEKGGEPPGLKGLPRRFYELDDVLPQELADLDYPWNLGAVEERIQEYSAFSESVCAELSARVMRNYNDFVQGMQQVQAVETELTLIGVLVKNGRRKLAERDHNLHHGSMQVSRQKRRSERLKQLLEMLQGFQEVVQVDTQLQQCLSSENYCEAIAQHSSLQEALATDRFKQFPGLQGLREGLSLHRGAVQQKLSDGLRVAAVSSEFHAERYEEILRAYGGMSSDQATSAGKELLQHVSECILAVSRQCMLAFSAAPSNESPAEWHRKAQIRELCRGMDPTHFVACTAQLYEHLCDFLYRHQFLCAWHVQRMQALEADSQISESDAQFREILRAVLSELSTSKRIVWDRIQQQVSLVLMTLDFQYPALSEDNFLHILHLTQLLVEEGDAFMSDYQGARSQGAIAENRRQWSAPIRNTLKSKANDYFQSLHFSAWAGLKVAYIEQDGWQRLPVPRSYRLIRAERLRVQLPPAPEPPAGGASSSGAPGELGVPRLRTAENNPFRGYRPELFGASLAGTHDRGVGGAGGTGAGLDGGQTPHDAADEDEHALLRHWIDDSESLAFEQIGSSMLSNSNRSPVVGSSTVELARVLERYFRMMGAIPTLATDIFQSAAQLIKFYVHCVLCLFVQDRHLRLLLEDLEAPPAPGDQALAQRHEAFLLQRLCPELRYYVVRAREFMASISLPPSCAQSLGVQSPATGAVLLQVMPYPELSSPSSICGLAERCVGVESVSALLNDLREVRQWLATLLPRGGSQEIIERFFQEQEVVASQLRTFVLSCASRDILEFPDMGRVSLDHFSNTVSALKWDTKDFSQGSPAAPYLEQLKGQIDELARRIPCAGGGSIPHATQRLVWAWMEVRLMHECAEVVSKAGKRKSQEALFCMAEDFQTIRNTIGQNFRNSGSSGAGAAEDLPLLPPDHPLAGTVVWDYLFQYLQTHGSLPSDALVWCKRHTEYPLRVLRSLIDYLHPNSKAPRAELEAFLLSYMADECSSAAAQRGL